MTISYKDAGAFIIATDNQGAQSCIPKDPANSDYCRFLEWCDDENSPEPAETSDELAAKKWQDYQAKAQVELDKTDLVALRCFKAGVVFPDTWATYVGALRAIVSASSGDYSKALPKRPNYPSGS